MQGLIRRLAVPALGTAIACLPAMTVARQATTADSGNSIAHNVREKNAGGALVNQPSRVSARGSSRNWLSVPARFSR